MNSNPLNSVWSLASAIGVQATVPTELWFVTESPGGQELVLLVPGSQDWAW